MKKTIKTLLVSSFAFLPLVLGGCNFEPQNNKPTPSETTQEEDPTEEEELDILVTGVSLNKETMPLVVSGTGTLIATISPAKATNKEVTWSSSDESVATVEEGVVTAHKIGQTTITVTTVDGGFTATCLVTVQAEEVNVTGVNLNYTEYEIEIGDSIRLVEEVLPSGATNQNVTWESSNTDVLSVENGVITAIAAGEATVTVTTVDGGFTATCVVTVVEKINDDAYVPDPADLEMEITAPGEYTFTGEISKQIYVNSVEEGEVVIILNGATLNFDKNSPIYVKQADTVEISAAKGTKNVISDNRAVMTEEDDTQGKGAIYVADGDLKIKSTGTLTINAGYNNGIHGKDDVKIQKATLNVTAPNHAIKGNDSITVASGTLNLTCGGDGLKTENSDAKINEDGSVKQRGDITIEDGTINIDSLGDAMSAAHDVVISGGTLTLKTDKYSSYTGSTVEVSESKFYLKLSESLYKSYGTQYTFAALIGSEWYAAAYTGKVTTSYRPGPGGPSGGGSTTYYVFEIEKPTSASSFALYLYQGAGLDEFSTTTYYAKADTKTFSSVYDMIQVSSISSYSKSISLGSWTTYVDSPSTKGIKAENEVNISAGTINIQSLDDGIHANNDGSLENGEKPLGNVNISGGELTIASDDDGIHADGTLEISGGKTTVSKAYEGLEGNIINMKGGEAYVIASDDGVNARTGNYTPAINVSGGYLDVTVSSNGDTDGIDSNGSYTQTGGIVIARGPNSQMAAALDTDGTASITGGTIIVLGALGENGLSKGGSVKTYTLSLHSSGSHTISVNGESLTFTNAYSYSKTQVYSSVTVA